MEKTIKSTHEAVFQANVSSKELPSKIPPTYGIGRFLIGSLSCMIPLPFLNPVEVVKIRLQLQGELQKHSINQSELHNTSNRYRGLLYDIVYISKTEGIGALYKGFTPSLMREGVYAGLRLGLYEPLKGLFGEDRSSKKELSFWKKIVAGAIAGGIGAALANPTDVVKIRMQAEVLSAGQRPMYKNTFSAFYTIYIKEGFLHGLYKGVLPNTQRACIISAAMMPTYDHTKHFLLGRGWIREDSISAHAM